jgi:hypothetical protein
MWEDQERTCKDHKRGQGAMCADNGRNHRSKRSREQGARWRVAWRAEKTLHIHLLADE